MKLNELKQGQWFKDDDGDICIVTFTDYDAYELEYTVFNTTQNDWYSYVIEYHNIEVTPLPIPDYEKLFEPKEYSIELMFEDENYTVVLPTCRQDVVDEAFSQCNCVFRCYYESLIKGFTNMVFVRDKQNPKKSLITCEVTNNGDISLYLLAHNQDPKDENQIRFRVKYQAYLRGVFNND